MFFKNIVQQATAWLLPPQCIICRKDGDWLCEKCQRKITAEPWLVDPVQIPGVDLVLCRGSYDLLALQKLITGIKYQYYYAFAEILPQIFTSSPIPRVFKRNETIIPVPLHRKRMSERGFNQSVLIAQAVQKIGCGEIRDYLVRSRNTAHQARLNEKGRETNLLNAFTLKKGVEIKSNCGIIVDDVITTGSTIRECASVLRRAGMEHITAIALAKG